VKVANDMQLSEPLRHALYTAYERLTAEFKVDRLVLFGSVVRGESDEESDADLLIVLTEQPTHQTRDRITRVILDINLQYGTNLSELIVDRQTWEYGLPSALPIHAEIETEGIRL
jgi:predicted nucleotidyltransferase